MMEDCQANAGKGNSVTLHFIGRLRGDIGSRADAPKNYSESSRKGVLEIDDKFLAALHGIEAGQTIVVLFWLHESVRDVLQVYPRGDTSRGLTGVFATRSPVRPNPVGISELQVLKVEGSCISVSGVDMLDGTPIIDIKKKI